MKTVLLIDDVEVSRSSAAAYLREREWRVLEASDGVLGLELARAQRPDAIVCDLLTVRGNGYQVCRAVRENPALAQIKVIVCSARDLASDHQTAMEAGADAFLHKPLEPELLQGTLEKLVLPGSPQAAVAGAGATPAEGMTRLKFWGVRGSIPTPGPSTVYYGGNTSCIEVRTQGEIIVLDAGSGIRPLGLTLKAEFGPEPINLTVLITHTHWDHIQGFPFFLPAYESKNHIRVLGFEGARDGLRSTLSGQMESPYFPIALNQMPSNLMIEELKDMSFSIGPVAARACFTNHPGVCVGYRLATPGGSVVYIPDNETFLRDGVRLNGQQEPSVLESNLLEFVRDVDLLILDTQYDTDEYARHVGWGHGCVDEVVRLAVGANVKRLFLFHHDPLHDDQFVARMLDKARKLALSLGSAIRIDAAREGDVLELPPL